MAKTLGMSESVHQARIERAGRQRGYLKRLKTQTEGICLAAVRLDGLALKEVQEQTEIICLEAVKENGLALRWVQHQTEAICHQAIASNAEAIEYVQIPTESMCIRAIHGLARLKYGYKRIQQLIPLDTFNIQATFLHEFPEMILTMKQPTEDHWLMVIQQKPYFLKRCHVQTEQICLEAVRRAGLTLKNVAHQTLEIVETALNQNGLALQYVKGFEMERKYLETLAVKQNPLALEFVQHQTEKLCWLALNGSVLAFRYIQTPTDEMKAFASDLSFKFGLNEPEFQRIGLTYLNLGSLDKLPERLLNPLFKEELMQFKLEVQLFREMMETLYCFSNRTNQVIEQRTGTKLTIEEALLKDSHILLLLPKEQRTYRRCRYAVFLNEKAKECSSYHALEQLETH